MLRRLLLIGLACALAACVAGPDKSGYELTTMVLPDGHVEDGRLAFVKLGCASCHRVSWEKHFPEPVSKEPAPVLNEALGNLSTGSVAASIIVPSHHVPIETRAVSDDGLSPMADFMETMTVRELIDIVAYLRSRGEKEVARTSDRTFDRN